MRGPHSIVSGARSREMVAQMREDHLPSRFAFALGGYGEEGDFTVRRCSRGGELSGGVFIHASIGRLGDTPSPWGSGRSLRPGWTGRQLERAISSLFMKAMREAHRRAHVRSLVTLAEEAVPACVSLDEVSMFSSEADIPECYCEMSLSDIKIWQTWLRERVATN